MGTDYNSKLRKKALRNLTENKPDRRKIQMILGVPFFFTCANISPYFK